MKLETALKIFEEHIGQPVTLNFIDYEEVTRKVVKEIMGQSVIVEVTEDKEVTRDVTGEIYPFEDPNVIQLIANRALHKDSKHYGDEDGLLGIVQIPAERLRSYEWGPRTFGKGKPSVVYPNRALTIDDGEIVETPKEKFLREIRRGDSTIVNLLLSPRYQRNILPDGSEIVNMERPGRVTDIEGEVLSIDSSYALMSVPYKPLHEVRDRYKLGGRGETKIRTVRIPLDRIQDHEKVHYVSP